MKALITGASSGIGREMAIILARMGHDLILVARRQKLLHDLKNELVEQYKVNVRVIAADLGAAGDCRALYEQTRNDAVDILVNNAGFGLSGPFDQTRLDLELEMIDVNIRAVHVLTKLFLVDFKRQNRGYILNVSSSAGFLPGPLMSTYYASKAYVLHLSQAIWEELRQAKSKVYIGALCPGPVKTGFNQTAKVPHDSGRGISSQYAAEYAIRKMFLRKRVIVPGLGMKAAHQIQRILPMRVLLIFCYRRMKRRGALEI